MFSAQSSAANSREPDHADPKLRAMSKRFHSVETEILHLDPEQRRPPPVHVVRIGEEKATVYRPSPWKSLSCWPLGQYRPAAPFR